MTRIAVSAFKPANGDVWILREDNEAPVEPCGSDEAQSIMIDLDGGIALVRIRYSLETEICRVIAPGDEWIEAPKQHQSW